MNKKALLLILLLPMTLQGNNLLNTAQPFTSIYGVKESEGRVDNLSVQFQYGIPDIILTSTVLGGGFITTFTSMAVIATGGQVGANAGIQSKTSLEYRSGHEVDAFFTVAFTGAVAANATQYIGMFDDRDGFAVGFNGTSFGILVRNNSVDTFIAQTSFNQDTLNGLGTSGFLYNRNNLNLFRIAYGWLGASIVKFQIMGSSGNWITFHIVQQPNSANTPSIRNPFLAMRAQVFDRNGGNILRMQTASWNMGIVAAESDVANRYFTLSRSISAPNLTETHLITIGNKSTFQSQPNKINVRLARYTGISTANAIAGDQILFRVYKNATVTGTAFSDVNTSASVTEFSTAGTYTASTGQLLSILPSYNQSICVGFWLPPNVYNIILYPNDTLTITVQALTGTNNIIGTLAWSEGF